MLQLKQQVEVIFASTHFEQGKNSLLETVKLIELLTFVDESKSIFLANWYPGLGSIKNFFSGKGNPDTICKMFPDLLFHQAVLRTNINPSVAFVISVKSTFNSQVYP